MTHAANYRNIESDVIAYKLSSESNGEIGKVLGKEASAQMLATLKARNDTTTGCHSFTFRYKDETIDSVINAGDYLVKLNTGKYVARTGADFESEFITTTADIVPVAAMNVVDNFTLKMQDRYLDLKIVDRADCLRRLNIVVEKLRDWYDAVGNTLTLNFSNYAMTSPADFHLLLNGFEKVTYIDDKTQFTLVFNNIGPASKNINDLDYTTINSLNYVHLQELIGELKSTKKEVRERITTASFVGTNGAPSAVATSVTEGQWLDIIDELRNVTGISRNASVTR